MNRIARAVSRSGGLAVGTALLLTAGPRDRLTAQDSVPPGYGTLRRDEITVRFTTGEVELQVLPLDEQVIRLLAPDTYQSLTQLIQAQRAAIDTAARRAGLTRPTLVMVTVLGLVPQARFNPDDLEIQSRGRLFRPLAIVPLSPTWGAHQLDARQQAVALYLFEEGISFREALTVSYQGRPNDAWGRSVRVLERERARAAARAQARERPSP
ncbi:MAG: hypothetical protein ACREL9_01930 [Gemmatimonadales bacterium]